MRRMAILGALVGAAALVLRARGPELHERVMAHCEAMSEHTPDSCTRHDPAVGRGTRRGGLSS